MCSIFLAVSQTSSLDIKRCQEALAVSYTRGPDYTTEIVKGNVYLGYNVLSITGKTTKGYNETLKHWLAFNGEIYGKQFYKNITDTEYLLQEIETKGINAALNNVDGMFGMALYDKKEHELYLGRDTQGEKTLYVYYDSNYFLVSSTLKSIETFIGSLKLETDLLNSYFHTRHFLTYNKTIYKNVFQIKPGTYIHYKPNTHKFTINEFRSIYSFLDINRYKENEKKTEQDLTIELDQLLQKNISEMISDKKNCISFSGGIDSTLIATYIANQTNNYELVATNCIGKDVISNNLNVFQPYFKNKIHTIQIEEKEWFDNLFETYDILRMPLPSHNFCTKLIFSKYLQKNNIKVCYGGEGADELFGGYEFYKALDASNKNKSPYSSCVEHDLSHAWSIQSVEKYINDIWVHVLNYCNDYIQATSFADFFLEVVDDGLRNSDQICGWFGIECRSPFVRREIIEFAINLPQQYKRGKPLLCNLFKKYYPSIEIKPKQGFAGFPNETAHYYSKPYDRFNIIPLLNINDFKKTREVTWKLINTELFYECYNSRYIVDTFRKEKR